MKISLGLKRQHQLSLTPSLTRGIELLQLSNLELSQEIQRIAAENPMLEVEVHTPTQHGHLEDYETISHDHLSSLESSLHWDLLSMHFDQKTYDHGCDLIHSLDESGFLPSSFWDGMSLHVQEKLKSWLLQLDTLGIGAHCVREALCWQLEYHPILKNHSKSSLLHHFIQQEHHCQHINLKAFKKKYRLSNYDWKSVENLFHQLSLRPRDSFYTADDKAAACYPDLVIFEHEDYYDVRLNEEVTPSLKLHEMSSQVAHDKNLKPLIQEAKVFIKNIHTRFTTLMTIAKVLTKHQQDFFAHGKCGLNPIILEDVARETGFHESTVSRVISNKFIQTPSGLFELKALLSRGIRKSSGEIASTTSIKEIIMELIRNEDPRDPLSDLSLELILKKQGFQIARRTIAKYRDQLGLATSLKRRVI